MDNIDMEVIREALERYYQKRVAEDREQWKDEGVRMAYHSLLRQAVEPFDRGEKDKAELDAHYQHFAGALDHMRKTWPWLDE